MPSASDSIALGWSAVGVKMESSLKSAIRGCPYYGSCRGSGPPLRQPGGRLCVPSALLQSQLPRIHSPIFPLGFEHSVHVFPRLGERDRALAEMASFGAGLFDPFIHVCLLYTS